LEEGEREKHNVVVEYLVVVQDRKEDVFGDFKQFLLKNPRFLVEIDD